MTDFIHTVTSEDEGLELKDIMREHFDFSSRLRNKIKREKLVMLNGVQTPGWIKPAAGDVIKITLPDERSNFEPQNIPLYPVFEDDDMLIINKQPGLIVHPTNLVRKRYVAIVKDIVESDSGTIDLPIGRPDPENVRRGVMEGGSPSVTHYTVLQRFPRMGYTLVELILETGRTHQIRVHMSHIGHPVLGDWLYGGDNVNLIERQALHAATLTFTHPITKKQLTLNAPLPDDMQSVLDRLV